MNKYNNVRFLDGRISKWGVFEVANNYLSQVIECRQNAAKDILCKQPVKVMDLGFSLNAILSHLSPYKNYCLVTFRSQVLMHLFRGNISSANSPSPSSSACTKGRSTCPPLSGS